MRVHFSASSHNLEKDSATFLTITRIVRELGHTFSYDWLNQAIESKGKKVDWKAAYKENVRSIMSADIVIAEASEKSASVGFQLALALQYKKPTLILSKTDTFKDSFIGGIDSYTFTLQTYKSDTVEGILQAFLKKHEIEEAEQRFNFLIDKKTSDYLSWASLTYGKTRSDIIRDLLNEKAGKDSYYS